ncbi:MAG: hypothetical protein IAE82_03010 [Opitutaceae bacterium]|nr:hypothetical protein [Opitutaceae bacterium]
MPSDDADTPLRRFERSMAIGYEQWHDGVGYDLDALRAASPAERRRIEAVLLPRATTDWRDVQALAALDTRRARTALRAAARDGTPEIRLAVQRYAPGLVRGGRCSAALVAALEAEASSCDVATVLEAVAECHPPEVVAALLRGALNGTGENAVHFAAMLMYVHGQAAEPFDWEQRPFFLRFNTEDRGERAAVFRELCARIGVEAASYLCP